MIDIGAAEAWAEALGLAPAPLFGADDREVVGTHVVLLDGGSGSIAMSSCNDEIWHETTPAAWAWSSDIPHHLTITDTKVAVTRWDMPRQPSVYDRSSVERGFERFYAFLINDRLRSNKTVVEHLLNLFRRLRSLSHASGLADSRATDVFGAILAEMIAPEEAKDHPQNFGLKADAFELTAQLDSRGVAATLEEFGCASGSLAALKLYPGLAVRHAAGQLFQEAHFELLRAPSSADLFGLIGMPETAVVTRGGTYFTPPPLARTVVEQAIDAAPELLNQAELTICDPACGSGAFLHETLRALRRSGYDGLVRLIGQDQSASAVSMAEFVLRTSLRDWSPAGGVALTLETGDSLGELGIPEADVVLMNPPFISFGSQSSSQRHQLKEAVGSTGAARGDYSMAFVTRALESLKPGGVLGTLFPASLLSLKAAAEWREMLLNAGEIRFLGSIGEFGLFAHAMVQVACAVIRKKGAKPNSEFTALVTQNDPAATSEALRWLRKTTRKSMPQSITETGWALFPVSTESLSGRTTWRLISPESDRALRAILDMQLPTIG